MKEVWKDIKGYEGSYQVSDLGRVRSLNRTVISKRGHTRYLTGVILKQGVNFGYRLVYLSLDGKKRTLKVHRIVCSVFLSNPDNLPCVNHKDRVRDNNNLNNLEWCTHKHNSEHAHKLGVNMPKGSSHGSSKLKEEDVMEIKLLLSEGRSGASISRMFNVSRQAINNIKNKKNWTHSIK